MLSLETQNSDGNSENCTSKLPPGFEKPYYLNLIQSKFTLYQRVTSAKTARSLNFNPI